jgi:hypothetical protein
VGFGHSKLDELDQRPPAATDPLAVWTRQPLWQQSGPSPTILTHVSIISIYESFGLRIKYYNADFRVIFFRFLILLIPTVRILNGKSRGALL